MMPFKNKYSIILFFLAWFLLGVYPAVSLASSAWTVSQISSNGSQQNGPIIAKDIIVWKDFRGPLGTDVWGYNLKTKTEFPIVQDDGFQSPTAIQGNEVLYDEYRDGSNESNVWLLNIKNGKKKLIVGGTGSRGGSHMDGNWVVYLEGYATGTLHAYNLKTNKNMAVAENASRPRISNGVVVWYTNIGGGLYGVRGYDLKKKALIDLPNDTSVSRQLPDINNDKVVWQETDDGVGRIVTFDLRRRRTQVVTEVLNEDTSYPTISNKYIAWRQGSGLFHEGEGQAYASIQNTWVKDLKSGHITQLTNYAPQQVSLSGIPSIFGNKITWFSWVTGNGDVYLADYSN